MIKLEELTKEAHMQGLKSDRIVRIISIEPVDVNAANVFYVGPDCKNGSQLLFSSNESRLVQAYIGRPWSFDAPGAEFKLGLEA